MGAVLVCGPPHADIYCVLEFSRAGRETKLGLHESGLIIE